MRATWLVIAFTLVAPAYGQSIVLQLDAANTRVDFTLADVLHTVHGSFRLKKGKSSHRCRERRCQRRTRGGCEERKQRERRAR